MPVLARRRSRYALEADCVARAQQCRLRSLRIEHHGVRAPDDVPPSRSRERIDRGLRTGDGDASRRDAWARLLSPWEHQRLVELAEIRETGDETENVDSINPGTVAIDYLFDR